MQALQNMNSGCKQQLKATSATSEAYLDFYHELIYKATYIVVADLSYTDQLGATFGELFGGADDTPMAEWRRAHPEAAYVLGHNIILANAEKQWNNVSFPKRLYMLLIHELLHVGLYQGGVDPKNGHIEVGEKLGVFRSVFLPRALEDELADQSINNWIFECFK
jgi:hypothetical protein